jgi:subfamily B ATP-binding cassette protein MsbA
VFLAIFSTIVVSLLGAVSAGALQPIFGLVFHVGDAPRLSLPGPLQDLGPQLLSRLPESLTADALTLLSFGILALLVVGIVRGIFSYLEEYLMNYVAEAVKRDIRDDLYANLHALSVGYFTRTPTGEVMSRLTFDVDLCGRSLLWIFASLLKEPFSAAGLFVVLFLINWPLTLIALPSMPLIVYPIVKFGKKIRARGTTIQERRAQLNILLQQTVSGIRIVKAFAMEAYERMRFARENAKLFRACMRIAKVDALSSPVLEVLTFGGVLIMVWLGGYLVVGGLILPEELLTFLLTLGLFFQPFRKIGKMNNSIQHGMAGVQRIFELMDTRPEIQEAPGAIVLPSMRERVAFRHVSFGYDEHQEVLRDVTISARMGEIVAIVGPSGTGKSTLVNLIPRFYDPTAGVVEIDGVDIRRVTLKSLREQIGMVTQEIILFDDTIFNNVVYGRRDVSPERVVRALSIANALEFIEKLPEGLETRIGESGVLLSGGQRQRIAIARAVVKDPPILILDEATSSLDTDSEELVQAALDRVMEHRTTFVIAHRLSTVRRADKVLVLHDGQVVEQGSHEELLAWGGTYARLYRAQVIEVGREA